MTALSFGLAHAIGVAARVLSGAYLITMMFSIGLELGGAPKEDRQGKRRQRRLLIRGLAFNLVLLPAVAYLLVRTLGNSGDVTIAMLLLAACPGGRFTPHLTKLAAADLSLSVEITLFLAKLTTFTAPVTARWVLGTEHLKIHELTFIARLLALQMAPYIAGRWVRRRRGALADKLARPAFLASMVCLMFLITLLLYAHGLRSIWALGGSGWLGVLLFATISIALGWLLGGPTPEARRTLAVGANARELSLAVVLANLAFPERLVQLATVGVWLGLTLLSVVFASLAGKAGAARAAIAHSLETQSPTLPRPSA